MSWPLQAERKGHILKLLYRPEEKASFQSRSLLLTQIKTFFCFLSAASCSLLRPTLPFSPTQVLSLAPLPVLRRMWEGAHQKNASSRSRCFSCQRKGQILICCLMPETSVGWFWQLVPGFPPRSLIVVSTPLLGIGLQQPHGLGSASQE